MKWKTIIILLLIFHRGFSQDSPLKSGPLIGYVDTSRAYIWVDAEKGTKEFFLKWLEAGSSKVVDSATIYRDKNDTIPVIFKIKNLKPGTTYHLVLELDKKAAINGNLPHFKTPEKEKAEEFSFLIGSCLYLNDPDQSKKYGNDPAILKEMSKHHTEFMIWGGDNTYLRNGEWNSRRRIAERYFKTRRFPLMQELISTRANFAVCDDHDYGPDDCTGSYEKAQASRETFKLFWPAKMYGQGKHKGIYHKFSWNDCDFFMMDDRTYRSPGDMPGVINNDLNRDKRLFGSTQLQWLIDELKDSKATFKFVVSGGQMLNPLAEKECFRYYNYEYNKLVKAIIDNKIEGVVFLSGDRHYTELIATQPEGAYTLFDFTCSSITSEIRNIEKTKEIDNPYRIPGTLCMENNFGKLTVTGRRDNRKIKIQTYDRKGKAVWDFTINESDVEFKEEGK